MNEAIFLDRDGVVIEDVDHLCREDQIRFIDGAGEAIKIFNDLGFLVFIVTNQPVVAYGMVSEEEIKRINSIIVHELERDGGRITEVFYCPHHPNAMVEEYRVVCECRKPSPGMLGDYDLAVRPDFTVDNLTGALDVVLSRMEE